jgi:hypothetical protein
VGKFRIFPKESKQAYISVTAEAMAGRMGHNDPYSGFAGVDLRDRTKTVELFPKADHVMMPQPIEVRAITASLT